MIIGHGDLASVLKDRKGFIFFASGVSNSQETRKSEYEREIQLLMKQDGTKHLVYFSTLAVFYGNTRYVRHKKYMEDFIKKYFAHYTIVRLGNITWGINPHTLINYLKAHRDAEVKDVYRYVVDKEEFLHWMNLITRWNCEMNITGRMLKVKDIIKEYVE